MNFLDIIKKILKDKKVNQEIKEETSIVGFDTSHIFLPRIKELS